MGKILKNVFISVLLVIQICMVSSCAENRTMTPYTTSLKNELDETTDTTYVKQTNKEESFSVGEGGGVISVQKYRSIYYNIPAPFADLVGRDNFWEWYNSFEQANISDLMPITEFVKYFNVTREQFDRANLKWATGVKENLDMKPCINPKDYANQMFGEVYNPDIIFTFDDELIREYYLSPNYPYIYDVEFEEAVEKGEYISQTEEWVDIEQMEAEIIAKYGETEIIPETATLPEETTV